MAKIKARHILLNPVNLEPQPVTGALQQVAGTDGTGGSGGGGGTAGEVTKVEQFITDGPGTVAGNTYVVLEDSPSNLETVRVTIIGGSVQLNELLTPSADFTMSAPDQLVWTGKGMQTALTEAGIIFIVEYSINIAVPDQASNVQLDSSGFLKILKPEDTDVQLALNRLDEHIHESSDVLSPTFTDPGILFGATGNLTNLLNTINTHAHDANEIAVGTFIGSLIDASETNVQTVLDVIDSTNFGNTVTITLSNSFAAKDIVRHNGTTWVKARANTISNCTGCWLVLSATPTSFTIQQVGRCSIPSHGYTPGTLLYLSADTEGLMTTVKPVGTLSMPLGFYLPIAIIEDNNTIQFLNKYPEYTPVLAEYIHGSLPNSDSIVFSNLDVNSYGGKINFELAMSTIASGSPGTVDVVINGDVSSTYNSLSHYDNGTAWARNIYTGTANMNITTDLSFSAGDTVYVEGSIARAASGTGSERVRLMARFINQDGTGGMNNSLQTVNITNITSVRFFAAGGLGYKFVANAGDYARILWTPPGI